MPPLRNTADENSLESSVQVSSTAKSFWLHHLILATIAILSSKTQTGAERYGGM